jgi:DNA-binding transcriptional ArsR family regulator
MTATGAEHHSVGVLADSKGLAAVLSPIRRQLLENLRQPDSASGLARRLGLPRQKINYHLRELENAGLVELNEEKQRRGCTERLVRVTARAFVISERFLEGLAADPEAIKDKFSSAFLVASAARMARDVAVLSERAAKVEKRLATLAIETEVTFASPAEFNSFSEELTAQVARLAATYNSRHAPGGRRFRIVVGAHPTVTKSEEQAAREAAQHGTKKKKEKK